MNFSIFIKKVRCSIIKSTNWAFAGILSLIGFAGCNINGGSVDMYGVPWSSRSLKGKVIDKETKKPIPNIEVKILIPDSIKKYDNPISDHWVDLTKHDGEFRLLEPLIINQNIPVVVNDIDGELNGSYESDTLSVDFSSPECINCDKGWFKGELTKQITIELQSLKKNEP